MVGGTTTTTVCVTGASGFIASWLVKLLLDRGYKVRGTVRNPEKAKHLLQLPGASDRLKLFSADLLEPGCFDEVVQGCDGVFHTASPIVVGNVTDPQAQLIDPAVQGTLNVLASCAKACTRRVVLTSSIGSVIEGRERTSTTVVDESWWSDTDICQKNKAWYQLSKTLAEKEAWNFVEEKGLDMVVINPSFTIGPALQATKNFTSDFILGLLNGTSKTYANYARGFVGVKDVAMAHILAYESANSNGRYICSGPVLHFADFVTLLTKLYPTYPICAKDTDESTPRIPSYTLSTHKLKELGLHFQPIEDVIHETVTSLKECGWLA